jgi:hypothetical protein
LIAADDVLNVFKGHEGGDGGIHSLPTATAVVSDDDLAHVRDGNTLRRAVDHDLEVGSVDRDIDRIVLAKTLRRHSALHQQRACERIECHVGRVDRTREYDRVAVCVGEDSNV